MGADPSVVHAGRRGRPWADHRQILGAAQEAGLLEENATEDVEELLAADSTIVRAHQHAARARHDSVTPEQVVREPAGLTGGRIELQESAARAR